MCADRSRRYNRTVSIFFGIRDMICSLDAIVLWDPLCERTAMLATGQPRISTPMFYDTITAIDT